MRPALVWLKPICSFQKLIFFSHIIIPVLDTYGFVENSQLQLEPFRSGRDGLVGTGTGCQGMLEIRLSVVDHWVDCGERVLLVRRNQCSNVDRVPRLVRRIVGGWGM